MDQAAMLGKTPGQSKGRQRSFAAAFA